MSPSPKPLLKLMPDDCSLRINRAIAQAGVCSRRKADELIEQGRVAVNGVVIQEPGMRVSPDADSIEVDGQPISFSPKPDSELLHLLLHKPPKVMTTLHDPQGRTTVLDLLPLDIAQHRPVPVGRLDFMSEGLLLMSTDGDFVHRLTHPRYHLPKVYEVSVRGAVPESAMETMRAGMRLSDGKSLAPVQAAILERSKQCVLLQLTLQQGVNRQIRRMCKDLRLPIRYLRRVAQGPVQLGNLPAGKWRRLTQTELVGLRKAVSLQPVR